jgi:hypothetical protein
MKSTHHESGQALVLGLSTFALSALGALYLLQKMRAEHGSSLNRTKNWIEATRTCQNAAHTLNSIAIHNQIVLKSLGKAANSWNEAAEWSLAFANAKPFWQKPEPLTEPHFIFEKFTGLATRSFTMAAANAYAARELSQNLMHQEALLQGVLSQSTNTETFCLATEKHFKNRGLYNTSHAKCRLGIFSGTLVQFPLVLQTATPGSLGMIVISDTQKMSRWMRSCRKTEDENLTAVVRNKRFENSLAAPPQKQKLLVWESMLVPAWTASLAVKGLVHNDFSR